MLTSKDLMIGDWYAFQGHPYKCTASDIASIAECEEKGAPTDISEIPLTAEILEKNGFVEHRDGFYATEQEQLAGDGFVVRNMVYYKSGILSVVTERGEIGIGIKFIHELQHALRLCGIEKEIEP